MSKQTETLRTALEWILHYAELLLKQRPESMYAERIRGVAKKALDDDS